MYTRRKEIGGLIFKFPSLIFYIIEPTKDPMSKFQHLDLVKFHTPTEEEKDQIFIVVDSDEDAGDDEHKSLVVKEIHQTLPFPCINRFIKADFILHHRPTEEEKAEFYYTLIKKGRK